MKKLIGNKWSGAGISAIKSSFKMRMNLLILMKKMKN